MTVDDNIKEDEKEAIHELRKRMKGDMDEELYENIYMFLRFLRARNLNVNNAEVMLRKHLGWRDKCNVKNISKFKKPEVMCKYASYDFLGYDKEGYVIRYSAVGNIDFSGVLSSLTRTDLLNSLILELADDEKKLEEQSKKLGRNIDKVSYILDFQNLSFAQVTDKKVLAYIHFLMNLYVNNYPERLKDVYAINASYYFSFAYSFVKTLLPATILEKVSIYSDDSYKEDLLKVIDADTLPAFLGGNRTDPDGNPLCLTVVNHCGERVPETYFISKSKRSLSKLPGVKKVNLSSASFHEIKLEVKEPGSYLEWEFETKCRDIGFGLFYEEIVDGEEKVNELIAIQRIDTEEYPETGTIKCENIGTYVIVFDNTYSWVRTKEIYYKARVLSQKEYEEENKG